ncbi:DUF6792 domain-containing protein [Gemella haemolysans]|uniref:DUF6792 domain-containing protein n=1 Tax=Gemella haemolysans TaxID=1379 RepID=UPI0023793B3C|nr:DUF6792 domain-containing protein [Gemella haemolysans]
MLRFFHNPLLIAKLAEYDYLIKGNKKQSTVEYKIKRIIKDVTGKIFEEIEVYNSGISSPKITKNGFQATAIYIPELKELLVIYRGSESEDISDWFYNYTGIVSGENTSQIDSACLFNRFLKRKIPDFDVCYKVAAGHSLGGHLAITVELLKKIYQRVYTFNTALPQLKQLRKYDKKYNKKLEEYFLEKDLEETNKLQEFTSNYYAQNAHHIYNFVRKNDFVQSLNMTVGTFHVGKTIEFPAIIKNFVAPEEFLTEEDTYELDKLFCDFYNRLLEKNITPDNVVENQKQVTDEFIGLLIEKIKNPIQQQISNFSYKKVIKPSSDVGITNSYRTFKAVYNYLLYLAHVGIIPDDVINCTDSKAATTLYEKLMYDVNKSNLKNLLKPLQEFYTLTKVIYTVTHANGLNDVGNWGEIAKAHDLPALYDALGE